MRRSKGFALVEIIVAIVALAVLASLLYRFFVRHGEAKRRAVCASNLKQIGLGVNMYSNDWNGWYPISPAGVGRDASLRGTPLRMTGSIPRRPRRLRLRVWPR